MDNQSCSKCGNKLERLLSGERGTIFDKPQETSKWDNFGYRAGYNMEKAKKERAAAEEKAKYKPYKDLD